MYTENAIVVFPKCRVFYDKKLGLLPRVRGQNLKDAADRVVRLIFRVFFGS